NSKAHCCCKGHLVADQPRTAWTTDRGLDHNDGTSATSGSNMSTTAFEDNGTNMHGRFTIHVKVDRFRPNRRASGLHGHIHSCTHSWELPDLNGDFRNVKAVRLNPDGLSRSLRPPAPAGAAPWGASTRGASTRASASTSGHGESRGASSGASTRAASTGRASHQGASHQLRAKPQGASHQPGAQHQGRQPHQGASTRAQQPTGRTRGASTRGASSQRSTSNQGRAKQTRGASTRAGTAPAPGAPAPAGRQHSGAGASNAGGRQQTRGASTGRASQHAGAGQGRQHQRRQHRGASTRSAAQHHQGRQHQGAAPAPARGGARRQTRACQQPGPAGGKLCLPTYDPVSSCRQTYCASRTPCKNNGTCANLDSGSLANASVCGDTKLSALRLTGYSVSQQRYLHSGTAPEVAAAPPGFNGTFCEYRTSTSARPRASLPTCQRLSQPVFGTYSCHSLGLVCRNLHGSFTCLCTMGWSGVNCTSRYRRKPETVSCHNNRLLVGLLVPALLLAIAAVVVFFAYRLIRSRRHQAAEGRSVDHLTQSTRTGHSSAISIDNASYAYSVAGLHSGSGADCPYEDAEAQYAKVQSLPRNGSEDTYNNVVCPRVAPPVFRAPPLPPKRLVEHRAAATSNDADNERQAAGAV
uniref:EGF-like domain-containing protein n=1 Tax=Macrostomum lignano TaxID=282301 RepID=A0A1I8FQD0_9PLAT